jgi:hypothetical protein
LNSATVNEPPDISGSKPDTVNFYVGELQRRFGDFERARQEELRHMKHDFVARIFTDHVALGDKSSYDCMLQGILKDKERELLETDPRFTKAWRIFVDLCWLKKQMARFAFIVGGIIVILASVVLVFWALPYLAGPKK